MDHPQLSLVIAGLAATSACGEQRPACDDTQTDVVVFGNETVERAVRTRIGGAHGIPIQQGDLCRLSELGVELGDVDASDLGGLESCTTLEHLSLSGNSITPEALSALSGLAGVTSFGLHFDISDVSPLSELTQAERLDLNSNSIVDVSPLSGLTGLTKLDLAFNDISDVSSLSALTALTELDLSGNVVSDVSALSRLSSLTELNAMLNDISDVAPLAGLTNLSELRLGVNSITDLGPLAADDGLAEDDLLWVFDNPLDEQSCCTDIPILLDRSVSVLYGAYHQPGPTACDAYPGCP